VETQIIKYNFRLRYKLPIMSSSRNG